jgi:hypothetical protein
MNLFQVPAQMVGFTPKKDRSYKLTFDTRELSGEEVSLLANNYQQEGWLLYKPNEEIELKEVPTEDASVRTKTPSQQLRNAIYVLWEQSGAGGDPEAFYRATMARLTDLIKSKLI